MGFDGLLGNEQLKNNLTAARRRGKLAHFYLICGPEGSGKHTLADLLAAAMLCQEPEGPCGVCRACRKVFSHSHPDDITIDDPEKKTVPVDLIRQARADLFVRPNEAQRKIYRFPRAQDLGIPGQNALLKVLEEPPEYGVFLLLSDNPEKLLPTVRSRCVELRLQPLGEDLLRQTLLRQFPDTQPQVLEAAVMRSGGYLGQAKALLSGQAASAQTEQFCAAFARRDGLELMAVLSPMEKWKRESVVAELEQWIALLEQALVIRSGLPGVSPLSAQIAASRSSAELMGAIRELKLTAQYAQANVSCAAVCGYLQWALR